MQEKIQCPLCSSDNKKKRIQTDFGKIFFHCDSCDLIFAQRSDLLSFDEEKERYLNHENTIENQGYLQFLNRVIQPMLSNLKMGDTGLDFGCGPSPTLSKVMKQKGFDCEDYDPLYFPDLPNKMFDYIFATECFEHFHFPIKDINLICSLLKPNSKLGIMTELWQSLEQFQAWYYPRDPTHVSFYSLRTFDFINQKFGLKVLYSDNKRVIILEKLV
jgi:SAM-dependent methyltransferase